MTNWSRPTLACIVAFATVVCSEITVNGDDASEALFENLIRPVLLEKCFSCHGGNKVSGGLRVDSRESLITGGDSGAAIIPEDPDDSLLIRAISRQHDVSAMPPEKKDALRPEQIAAFKRWILSGAEWPASTEKFKAMEHWAFQPVKDVDPPQVSDIEWSKNSIDAFIRARQEAAGVRAAPLADKRTLIRRATFDLTGLPPTPEEVDAFEQDSSPEAFAKLIDRLLASTHYGERWGRHWLDVVRYADTAGETADYPVPLAWKYRNYVIDAFNSDKPYDLFLREQIAGDILANQHVSGNYAEQVTATGYLAISRRFGFDSENYHHLTIQDTIDTLGQSVMGLSLGCARCHDHKFDPVTMQDYYAMYGIFDSSRYAFPGSEQKQRFRAMVPLVPADQAIPEWRKFDHRVASLTSQLEQSKQPVPNAILRSLHDMDGDFELQAPAAGGSNGVLVPPWVYSGRIAVTNAAQSPFRNLYVRGKVGASIAADAGAYKIAQALHPHRDASNCDHLWVNLDFRVASGAAPAHGVHEFRLGGYPSSSAIVVTISSDSIAVGGDGHLLKVADVTAGQWQNVQLAIDLADRSYSITVTSFEGTGTTTSTASQAGLSLNAQWSGIINFAELLSNSDDSDRAPGIEFDNLGVQEHPLAAASTESTLATAAAAIDMTELSRQLQELVGLGGDFETQAKDAPPASPWNPGPNSVVKIAERAQSPYQNIFPIGLLGIAMPNRGEYDGFGLTLPVMWKSDETERLHACFDFNCAEVAAGGDGSWRYYVGHGPGNSAAIELFMNGSHFFRRSGDTRDAVCSLTVGQWYQVQVTLNLKTRTYEGTIASRSPVDASMITTTPFGGEVSTGWDGQIDYSFIDSYGHIGGVRPALDVDNYEISTKPHPAFGANAADTAAPELMARKEQATAIQKQLATAREEAQKAGQELNSLLTDGPFPMAYGMAEGTPHDVPIQLRGEPSRPGDLVARGFIASLGGTSLPADLPGSGRLQLAEWLTSPQHPLTARVMVNRLWQYHFGRGLVKTPNDFGVRGLPPTHSELLDHLAAKFMRSGWSVKSMHRLIMLSRTYQLAAEPEAPALDDAEAGSSAVDSTDLYVHFQRRQQC
ncbi:MAG: PSD1 and planctomycete cytochrome C domain-containing protein [Planctomycetaceae bacterium]